MTAGKDGRERGEVLTRLGYLGNFFLKFLHVLVHHPSWVRSQGIKEGTAGQVTGMEEANLSVIILETLAMAQNIELSGGRMDGQAPWMNQTRNSRPPNTRGTYIWDSTSSVDHQPFHHH